MKKIGKILGMIGSAFIILIVIGAFFGLFDDEVADLTNGEMADNSRTMVETEDGVYKEIQTKEEAEEPEEEPVQEDQKEESDVIDNNHYYIGDHIEYESGLVIILEEAGIVIDILGEPAVYIDMELDNSASTDYASMYVDDFSIYIDDYQVSTKYTQLEFNDSNGFIEVNAGRKAKYVFRSTLPDDYDNASKIEVELPGSSKSILIKENGVYFYGQKEAPAESSGSEERGLDESMYGDHESLDGLDYVLNFEPDGWTDAVVTIKADYDHQWLLFMEDERNGYLTYMEGDDKVGFVNFSMDGIQFECDDNPEFNGLYW